MLLAQLEAGRVQLTSTKRRHVPGIVLKAGDSVVHGTYRTAHLMELTVWRE